MRRLVILFFLCIIHSCSTDNEIVDPLEGLNNFFVYDGVKYDSPGGAYNLYDKINGQYYYCFLVGTTGQFNDDGKNVEEATVDGNFVRIFLKADTLDKFNGSYDLPQNPLNIIDIDGTTDTIREGKLTLSYGENNRHVLALKAKSDKNKNLNLRAELLTGQIAYKLSRTVEGQFSFMSKDYAISRAWAVFKPADSQTTIAFEDDDGIFATQIVLVVNETDNNLDPTYPTNLGYVTIYDYTLDRRLYFSDFTNGKFEFTKDIDKYRVKIDIRTVKGDSITGIYKGMIEQ